MNLHEMCEKRDRLRGELDDLKAAYAIKPDSGTLERLGNLKRGVQSVEKEIVGELAKRPENREAGVDLSNPRTRVDNSPGGESRDAALRMVEERSEELSSPAADQLDTVIRGDRFGVDSDYLRAVADPHYERAFAKKLMAVNGAESILTAEENAAMLNVGRAMSQRALAAGEGATGGFPIPMSLDPSIILVSDGAINPLRELATVTPINTTKWAGVSSAGVEAKFGAEASESSDGSPTLAQPTIFPEKATIWCPFSIEVGQDWGQLTAELTKLFADARDTKEAEVFAVGKGSENIPAGITVGATKSPVETATKEVFAIADVYSLQESLPARWQAKATWLAANKVANAIHKFVATGDTSNATIMSDARDSILGKPFREVSNMSTKTTTKKEKILLYGDVGSAFRVVDRIGMLVEVVPHVLKEGKPTGQRGLYCFFRVGSKVIVPEAIRALVVKE